MQQYIRTAHITSNPWQVWVRESGVALLMGSSGHVRATGQTQVLTDPLVCFVSFELYRTLQMKATTVHQAVSMSRMLYAHGIAANNEY
jgi:hypothetical protein